MKTRKEVEELKKIWLGDGCWDIYTTEGFEEYHDELKVFQDEIYAETERKELIERPKRLGRSLAFPLDMGEGVPEPGLTKREYFAAMALQGMLANPDTSRQPNDDVAWDAVNYADALLANLV